MAKRRTSKKAELPATTKAARRSAAPADRLIPEPEELIVRMYRQGLGDCFLLAISAADRPRYLLIDCGVHWRQREGGQRLLQVMGNLVAATDQRIDVVIATHEHADHLSGFVQKSSPFLSDKLSIGELWVGWTEKHGDVQADTLRAKKATARQVIQEAVNRLRKRPGARDASLELRLQKFTDFERPEDGAVNEREVRKKVQDWAGDNPDYRPLIESLTEETAPRDRSMGVSAKRSKKPSSNELALALLTVKAERVRYCEPGNVCPISGVTSVRAHVLGPPRSALLKKERPSKVPKKQREHDGEYKEVYLTGAPAFLALELCPALDIASSLPDDMRYPFSVLHRKQLDTPGRFEWLAEYNDEALAWRRIDHDWLDTTEQLALNLDADTNNTSLTLAFELGSSNNSKVLLFTGDAQVGNWLSWRDQTYGAPERATTADDLLKRAALYKVGHHGSHNATVKRDSRETTPDHPLGEPFGLELMNDIIAMIPVDRDAAEQPRPWDMPHRPLYLRLRELAKRRVLRSDMELAPLKASAVQPDRVPTGTGWEDVPGMEGVRWRQSSERFNEGTDGPLYYDIAFPLSEE